MNCQSELSSISLDSNQIISLIFSDDEILEEYRIAIENLYFDLDLKTYFEMLVIVTTGGLKKFYRNDDGKVNLYELEQVQIDYINSHLNKLKVKLNINIVPRTEWIFDDTKKIKSYKEVIISRETKLEDLNYILDREDFFVISYTRL